MVVDQDDVSLEELVSHAEVEQMDLFDAMQLKAVIGICRQSKSMSGTQTIFCITQRQSQT